MHRSIHILLLINDILDMSKIEDNKLAINCAPFHLKEMTEGLSALVYPQAVEKELDFNINFSGVTEDVLIGDSLRVNQVLINLLSNSLKFTPHGGKIGLDISRVCTKGKTITLRFVVYDNGIGMTEEFVKRLFDPFEQADSSIAQKYGGTGLGMSITKNLVALMQGTIAVESEIDKGTSITLEIPFEVAEETAFPEKGLDDIEELADGDANIALFEGKKVLLAEDNEINQEIATYLLNDVGLTVDWATNGKQALEKFENSKEGEYAIILMDIQMPIMDGYIASQKIRESAHSNAKTVPIIAMTANAFDEDVQQAKDAGMNGHIAKPIEVELLYDTLAKNFLK